jgi:copper chaperone CopZ
VINRALDGVKGVRKVGVSYMLDLVFVDHEPSVISREEIIGIIKKAGYDAIPVAG